MNEYAYRLRTGSRKEICPNCGQLSFNDVNGVELSPEVGRCDRAQKCCYHYPPAKYFADRRIFHPETPKTEKLRPAAVAHQRPDYIETSDLTRTLCAYDRNPLYQFAERLFSAQMPPQKVEEVFRKMGIGTSRQFGGSTIFWLVDKHGRIRDGKIMGYNPATGKRIKSPRPLFTNVHTVLKEKYPGRHKGCWFGSHLLCDRELDNRYIWLFESEKAALIFSLLFEAGGLWLAVPMATGGCSAFSPTSENMSDPYHGIQALRGRKVVLFPDEGKLEEWSLKMRALEGFCEEVRIADWLSEERRGELECEVNPGDGPDDLMIRYIRRDLNPYDLMLKSY